MALKTSSTSKANMVITCGIYLYNVKNKKILVCHATHASWRQWSIPKGLKDGKEDFWKVAVRELMEETGIDLGNLKILKIYPLPPVKYLKQNKRLESFLIITDSDLDDHHFKSNIENSIPEIDSWKWITISQAYSWLHESQAKNLDVVKKILLSM